MFVAYRYDAVDCGDAGASDSAVGRGVLTITP